MQAVAQQIPCAQVAERHSALVEQEPPLGLRPHELAVQTFPVEHSALVYGIAADGNVTTLYPANFDPKQIVHDVPLLEQ